jgi:glycosyltransferase involved in cell wall biosynthesis
MSISVVIPAYNAERHIGEALASIRDQDRRDVEVIIVDDGSTDDTLLVAEQFASGLDLVIVRQANAGPAAARNAGIRRARGQYCAFLDADDRMLPGRLSSQVELLGANPELGLVHTDLMTFDDTGIIHRSRRVFSDPCGGMVLHRLLLDNFITTSTVMAPTARLLEVGLFGEGRRVSEDFELWLRMAARWPVGYIDRPLVEYRRRPGSLSDDKLATALCGLDVVEAFWREHPQHRRRHPRVYGISVAEHLTTAGSAALARGYRGRALGYLSRALRFDPWKRRSWKTLAKALLRPTPVSEDGRASLART